MNLYVAIASFLAAVAVNSNAADVAADVLPTCESVNATDANCKVYCRDNGYDTSEDGGPLGSAYTYINDGVNGVKSSSCLCKNMDSFNMTTVCTSILSTASPVAAPAVAPADGVVPTCASMGITAAEQCHEACDSDSSTWQSVGVSDSIGGSCKCESKWMCADQELPSGASASSCFVAISVALVAAVLL